MYASRILLETLALSMTLPDFGAAEQREGRRLLAGMRRASKAGSMDEWFTEHRSFHHVLTSAAPESLRKQLDTLADRSIRYIRIYQLAQPMDWQSPGDREHAQILRALREGDGPAALTELAQHLSHTALRVLADCKPDFEPVAVPHAVALVSGRPGAGSTLSAAG